MYSHNVVVLYFEQSAMSTVSLYVWVERLVHATVATGHMRIEVYMLKDLCMQYLILNFMLVVVNFSQCFMHVSTSTSC